MLRFVSSTLALVLFIAVSKSDAAPSVADALKLTPIQEGVTYDTPSGADVEKCTIKAEKVNGITAWVVRDPEKVILRQFSDTNGDNVVDMWSYFRDGLEVYRDLDSNNNGKADQFRWFHSEGIRWALDTDEDTAIDSWKLISPEELAEEVVEALKSKDAKRFKRLLISSDEISKLGLDSARSEQLEKHVDEAGKIFEDTAKSAEIGADLSFSDFGGVKPGIVPAGSQGVSKDLMVYENVWAMVHTGDSHRQLHLGTLISIGGSWKLIQGPTLGTTQDVAAGFFFDAGGRGIGERAMVDAAGAPAPSEELQATLDEIQKIDGEIIAAAGDPEKKPALNLQRAKLLLKLANEERDPQLRSEWLKQLADSVSAATQEGSFPQGVAYLRKLEEQLANSEEKDDQALLPYFEFHRMVAEYYGVTLAKQDVNIAAAQEQWLKDLKAYVDKYPRSEDGAEALRALAMGYEMAGETQEAVQWYREIVEKYPDNVSTSLAKGAITRLTSEGKEIAFHGTDLEGNPVDLKSLRGKAVVIQYWTTTSEVSKADHAVLKELIQKYGGKALEVVSVCLDFNREPVMQYLQQNRLPWKQLYEPQGFDGPLASDLGVVTVPLTIMVGPDGKVISNNIQVAEIESELKKL